MNILLCDILFLFMYLLYIFIPVLLSFLFDSSSMLWRNFQQSFRNIFFIKQMKPFLIKLFAFQYFKSILRKQMNNRDDQKLNSWVFELIKVYLILLAKLLSVYVESFWFILVIVISSLINFEMHRIGPGRSCGIRKGRRRRQGVKPRGPSS